MGRLFCISLQRIILEVALGQLLRPPYVDHSLTARYFSFTTPIHPGSQVKSIFEKHVLPVAHTLGS